MGVVSLTMGNSALPLGDRFIAHAELFGELLLREAERLSLARNVLSDPDEIHKTVLLCVDRFLYSRTAAKRTPPESRILSFHGEMRRAAGVFSLQTNKFDAILSLYDLRQKRIGRRKKE